MAPSSSLGCLGGVAAVTVAAGGILEQVGRAILFILDRRAIKCLECGKEKQPEKMQKHVDKHRWVEFCFLGLAIRGAFFFSWTD